MDLRNGTITIKEILRVPEAQAILLRELPQIMHSSLVKMAANMQLDRVLSYAKGNISPEKLENILQQLKAL